MPQKTEKERIEALEKALENIPTKADIEEIVVASIKNFFEDAGKTTKGIIMTIAAILTSLAVIGVSLKWLLGVIGYHFISNINS